MSYTLNQNFSIEHFEDWARKMEYFALSGIVHWAEDDNEESPVEWTAVAACQDDDLARAISERYDNEHDRCGKSGTRHEFEFPFFLGKLRSGWGYAIFETVEAKGDQGEPIWYPKGDLPVAITLTSADTNFVVDYIKERGGTAIVEGYHFYPDTNDESASLRF